MKQYVKLFENFIREAIAKPDLYYTVVYLKKEKTVTEEDFATREEADAFAKTQTMQKNTYAYVFEMPKDKSIYEEYLAILPFKSASKTKYVGYGLSASTDLFNKSALAEYIEEMKEHLKRKTMDGSSAGLGWQANLNAIKKGIAAVEKWFSVVDQLPPSDLNRSNDNFDAFEDYMKRQAEMEEKIKNSWNAKTILDGTIKIGNLEVTVNRFPSQNYTFEEAEKICSQLGSGWRLPSKEELQLIMDNKDKIGNVSNRDKYWSNTLGQVWDVFHEIIRDSYEAGIRAVKG